MDTVFLTTFFGWCTALNMGLLVVWALAWMLAPDLVYRTQTKFFPRIERAKFDHTFYVFLGAFKVAFLFFNLIPYLALLMMAR